MSTSSAVEELSRYEVAAGVLDGIFGPAWRDKTKVTGMKAVDDFQRLAVEHCYTDTWARDTLNYKIRSVSCLSMLAALGSWDEFKLHVEGALANGLTHEDIFELILHFIPYIGVPRSINALKVAGETFQELFARDAANS